MLSFRSFVGLCFATGACAQAPDPFGSGAGGSIASGGSDVAVNGGAANGGTSSGGANHGGLGSGGAGVGGSDPGRGGTGTGGTASGGAATGGSGAGGSTSSRGGASARGGTGSTMAGSAGMGALSGGSSNGGGGGGASPSDHPAGYVKALIGVGYGGLRIVSRDNGKTWGDRASDIADGKDDEYLLRAVVYGKGRWIATGWKLWTSDDGVNWTPHGMIKDGPKIRGCSIVEGLAYKDGYFYAACPVSSPSEVFRSEDGLSWTSFAKIGDTSGHLFMTYRGNLFAAYGDTKKSFTSSDAKSWTLLDGVSEVTYCDDAYKSSADCLDAAWFNGVWLREEWGGDILRSTDGKRFDRVYRDDQSNTLYRSRAMAEGYVAP